MRNTQRILEKFIENAKKVGEIISDYFKNYKKFRFKKTI